jgi:predicted secreted Zn-dependent protease
MHIRKVKGGWKIDNTPGISKTKRAAKRRLRAIKYRQKSMKKYGKGRKRVRRMK